MSEKTLLLEVEKIRFQSHYVAQWSSKKQEKE